ncbi:MAG TPA: transketolase C-terminal domain-containing protein [Actinomycetota bacterium]|jgi:transketolase|nr:transketolase C-terminal domain-containing protein [Actinomycetota bacterium]
MPAATRDAFGEAIVRVGKDERIVVLTGDLRDSTRTEDFAAKYPDRFVECGIAESNMLGIASGLAMSGKIPWACSFSCFVTGRFETVRLSVAYQDANVRIVGTHTGIGVGEDGYSQMSLEDIAMIRALPNVAVINPADAVEADRAVEYLVDHEGPAFLRLTRQKVDDVNGAGYRFEFGKAVQLRDGTDVALVATGATVAEAVKAAEALNGDGISARVLNVHTIHPLDEDAVLAAASDCRAIVTVEDHSVRGGLGSAVAEVLAQGDGAARLHVIGLRTFGESGTSEELYEKYGLAGDRIAETTRSFLGNLN